MGSDTVHHKPSYHM